MAWARYRGDHAELSVSLPDWGLEGGPVELVGGIYSPSKRIEVCALPPGAWRIVSPWCAVWLAAARQRYGPWVDVKIPPREWQMLRRRAPWLRKAEDALRFTGAGVLERWRMSSVQTHRVENEQTLGRW